MIYGAPKAYITKDAIPATTTDGPIAYAPNIPPIIDNDSVAIRVDIQHKKITVANGVCFWAWTFGDSIPGPVLRVRVGQTIKFSMVNRSNLTAEVSPPMPHSIDFHAAMVDPHDKYRSINPGETLHFQWTANYAGVFMYHCGTPVILQHMISGMTGMIIVEPEAGFPGKVDKEFAIVQNEYYLKPKGDSLYETDVTSARNRQPMFVTFNGKSKQYVQQPLEVKAGDRVRLYVLNTGPNLTSSFHVVGTIFDKVWIDGNPKNEFRGMQTVLLGSSNGAIVEFIVPEKGTYVFVDHSFASVEQGAVGLIEAK
ncbi:MULTISPECIES: multicopper oxidase domain-containing protein [Niastella]|uniref:Copper-containing nitrite reductase n=1 Tax=Niastella soli TaxID=2821487 RepID=A0ABS3YT09_9BACT|nr:multicopper oxidase domain-containing protein [Niastella soli]MBO9201034.1 multicopper oxidase domain-containing protein [Niastella soli]